jgi:hypothetical protein
MSILNDPKVIARTPPPTLLFPSQQCQRAKPIPFERTEQSLKHPRAPFSGPLGSEAPRRQSRKNRAADEDVLSEPLPKVNTFFEVFSRNRHRPNALFQYPAKLQHSRKRIRFCVYLLQSDIIDPETFSFRQRSHEGLPYTGAHGSCRGLGPCRTPDQDPDEQGDPKISVMPASFEIEARPN